MRLQYVMRRFLLLFLVVWVAATLNFFLPRLGGRDPIRQKLMEQAGAGGYVHTGIDEMVQEYNRKFGLDKPLWQQYLTYLGDVFRLDLGYSIAHYPRRVSDVLAESLPWTIGLLATTTILAFVVGTILGALLGWPKSPRFVRYLFPPLLTLSAVPYFLLGLLLLYLFAFRLKLLPLFGGYTPGTFPSFSLSFALDVLRHSILPAASILLASLGFWALGMRAMTVTVEGEDFMTFAEAIGLRDRTLFYHYVIRNALLPQTTALGLALGQILSGALLVEVVFSFPGIGTTLYHSIRTFDYFMIQGIVFTVVLGVTFATFILDLLYPLIDPRITYQAR